jgi:hypothetical protein
MQNEFSAEQQQQLLEKLTIPFHPDAISWRVTNKSKDGKRGCVIPYAFLPKTCMRTSFTACLMRIRSSRSTRSHPSKF